MISPMSRPIPIEIIPSHIHLSEDDHRMLFGSGFVGTVERQLSQRGQFVYRETVEVSGRLKRLLRLRVLGPHRRQTQIELTPSEAAMLGIAAGEARSGDLSAAASCTLTGPHGQVAVKAGVIIPRPHLHLSDVEAKGFRLKNGDQVDLELLGDAPQTLERVIVRVHPTYSLRLHVHPDLAREGWYVGNLHARLRESKV